MPEPDADVVQAMRLLGLANADELQGVGHAQQPHRLEDVGVRRGRRSGLGAEVRVEQVGRIAGRDEPGTHLIRREARLPDALPNHRPQLRALTGGSARACSVVGGTCAKATPDAASSSVSATTAERRMERISGVS